MGWRTGGGVTAGRGVAALRKGMAAVAVSVRTTLRKRCALTSAETVADPEAGLGPPGGTNADGEAERSACSMNLAQSGAQTSPPVVPPDIVELSSLPTQTSVAKSGV